MTGRWVRGDPSGEVEFSRFNDTDPGFRPNLGRSGASTDPVMPTTGFLQGPSDEGMWG
jgi:hypothetical protein